MSGAGTLDMGGLDQGMALAGPAYPHPSLLAAKGSLQGGGYAMMASQPLAPAAVAGAGALYSAALAPQQVRARV